jgi:hypothetical protein
MPRPSTLDDLFGEEETRLANLPEPTPAERTASREKSQREWERGIALGWFDADGNAPSPKEDEDDDGEDDDGEDDDGEDDDDE